MEKNFTLAIALMILIYIGWFKFIAEPKKEALESQKAVAEETQEIATTAIATTTTKEIKLIEKVDTTAKPEAEKLFELETPTAKITFTSKGAGIKTYEFKDILGPVNLTPNFTEGYFASMPEVNFDEIDREENAITFKGKITRNVDVLKIYKFNQNGNLNTLDILVKNNLAEDISLKEWYINFGPGLGTVKSEQKENSKYQKAVYLVEEAGKKNPSFKNLRKEKTDLFKISSNNWLWAGMANRYFLTALIPQNWESDALAYETIITGQSKGFFGKKDIKSPVMRIIVPQQIIKAGERKVFNSKFYFGPKDYDKLLALPYRLDKSVEFGFFGQFGKWAKAALNYLYGITGNYGYSIIIIAFLLQVLMLPLTLKSIKSSEAMKKIQPELKEIQKRYKDEPQRLNKEMFALYKKHGANPMGGCLPLLIQLPVFIALFNALRTSWELHGAPWALWIHDLSAKDPYYVLPILMGAIMFFQMNLTMPQGGNDPMQKSMKWMPIIFTFLFLSFPAGLVLYWLTNSALNFALHMFLKSKKNKPAIAV